MDPSQGTQGPWGGLPPLSDLFQVGSGAMMMGAVGDLLWAVAYIFFVVIGFRQRTYAVPLLAVCLNFSWEFAFIVIDRPDSMVVLLPHLAWLLIDAIIVYQALRYGKGMQSNPDVRKHFYLLFGVLALLSFVGEQAMHRTMLHNSFFPDMKGHTVAFFINLVMSVLFITFLMGRPDMRGISIAGAWTKMLGTALISAGNVIVFMEGSGREFQMQLREITDVENFAAVPWGPIRVIGTHTLQYSFYYFLFVTIFLADCFYLYLVYRRRAQLRAQGQA